MVEAKEHPWKQEAWMTGWSKFCRRYEYAACTNPSEDAGWNAAACLSESIDPDTYPTTENAGDWYNFYYSFSRG